MILDSMDGGQCREFATTLLVALAADYSTFLHLVKSSSFMCLPLISLS
jgi:hypothetical protein